MQDTFRKLRALEEAFITDEIRQDAGRLDALLADSFTEIAKSGKVFDKQAVVAAMANDAHRQRELHDFQFREPAPGVVLVTYRCTEPGASSLRCSFWVEADGHWQLVHHQGTLCP